MYAIVRVGGKQYRVEKGDTLVVDRLRAGEGDKVALEPLLFRSDDAVFDGADLGKVKVEAIVRGHERGKKIRVFKFKPKRGYKKTQGHRSELTRLEIADISMGGAKRAAAAKPKADAASSEKASAAKASTASKEKASAAKASTASKEKASETTAAAEKGEAKPAAKKPAAKKPPAKKETDDGS